MGYAILRMFGRDCLKIEAICIPERITPDEPEATPRSACTAAFDAPNQSVNKQNDIRRRDSSSEGDAIVAQSIP